MGVSQKPPIAIVFITAKWTLFEGKLGSTSLLVLPDAPYTLLVGGFKGQNAALNSIHWKLLDPGLAATEPAPGCTTGSAEAKKGFRCTFSLVPQAFRKDPRSFPSGLP